MNRSFHILAVLLLVLAVGAIYQLKHMVEAEQRLLHNMHVQYMEDSKAIRVLRAEWAYVNSPEYLQSLSNKHLDLGPIVPKQVAADVDALPMDVDSLGRLAGMGQGGGKLKSVSVQGTVPFWDTAQEGGRKK